MTLPPKPRLPRLQSRGVPSDEPSELPPSNTGDLRLRADGPPLLVEMSTDLKLRIGLEEARELVRARLARAELIRTGAGWTLLRSTGVSPEGSSRGTAETHHEVVLAGALGEAGVSMVDVVGFLAGGQQTGVLSVHVDDVERSVYLRRGDIVWASSSATLEQIGPFLVRRGKITEAQLAQLAQSSPVSVGRSSVERGLLAAHELFALVREQLLETFELVLGAERGVWTFARTSEESLSASQVAMPTHGLLLDAMRRLDEMRIYRQVVRSSSTLLRRRELDPSCPARLEEDLRARALDIHAAMQRSTSVREVMQQSGLGEFEVTRLVYALHRAGLVEVLREEAPSLSSTTSAPPREVLLGLVSTFALALREVLEELAKTESNQGLVAALREVLTSPPREHQRVMSSIRLLPNGLVDERGSAVALELLGVSREELRQGLSELVLFALFEVSARIHGRRRDDLARRVKMIQQMAEPHDP